MYPDLTVQFARSATALSAVVDGETVILNVDSGSYCGLDASGTAIWEKMLKPIRIADLVADLLRDYDAAPARIEADVADFVRELSRLGLITTQPDP